MEKNSIEKSQQTRNTDRIGEFLREMEVKESLFRSNLLTQAWNLSHPFIVPHLSMLQFIANRAGGVIKM